MLCLFGDVVKANERIGKQVERLKSAAEMLAQRRGLGLVVGTLVVLLSC